MSDRKRRKPRNRRDYGRGKGAKALQEFLDRNHVSDQAAADAMGVTRPAVISWTTGRSIPGAENRKKIERWTDGAVGEALWEDERAIDQVQPFSPEHSNGDAA